MDFLTAASHCAQKLRILGKNRKYRIILDKILRLRFKKKG
jgi:hypothetical protein